MRQTLLTTLHSSIVAFDILSPRALTQPAPIPAFDGVLGRIGVIRSCFSSGEQRDITAVFVTLLKICQGNLRTMTLSCTVSLNI